jgi:dienelactone hydrolase
MRRSRLVLATGLPALLVAAWVLAPPGSPRPADAPKAPAADPRPVAVSDEVRKAAEERGDKLAHMLDELRRLGVPDTYLVDVEVYRKAALWALRLGEFYDAEDGQRLLDVLDRGLLRAAQLARGETPWLTEAGRPVARGYRSRIDGSVQPYAVTFPAEFGKERQRRWRLDVVLHDRDPRLTEVRFLHARLGAAEVRGQDWVQVDVYGRGNTGYRWAGETDVWEAADSFLALERQLNRAHLLDPARVLIRGFGMGGTGTWQTGLHRPDRFCVLGPGAGCTSTRNCVKDLPAKLPDYQQDCLHIYDAVDYAENAFNVPVVAFAGGDDPELAAARAVEERLRGAGVSMSLLVAPGVGHALPPEWRQKAEAEYERHADRGRPEYPAKVRFETYTLRYPSTDWVEILALDRHYHRARVEAEHGEESFTIKTSNVRALHLTLPPGSSRQAVVVTIDGQKLEAVPYLPAPDAAALHLYLERRDGRWEAVWPERLAVERLRHPQKVAGLHGPIDDAFAGPFLCVRGRGPAWHDGPAQYADACLERFRDEWARHFRGELPVKDDTEVTPQDLATRHLVLFGDPSSNPLIAQVLPGLPLSWTRDRLAFAGREYDPRTHLPAMIYPSPLAADRYVVLNSGHTFHAADFRSGGALLFPRLGDWAIVKVPSRKEEAPAVEVAGAGLFDDFWRPPAAR